MSYNRGRLLVQLWGQAEEIVLAFAREKNVTRWEAARMLICKGAGVEYVRPPRGRLPKGQRRTPPRLRTNMAPDELHELRVSLGKRIHGENYVPISQEEMRRRNRELYARKAAEKAAAEGRAYEYRPFGTPEHAAKIAAIDEIERLLRTLQNPPRYVRHAAVKLARLGLPAQEAFEHSAAFKQERRARLLAQLPAKLRTETRWNLILSELAAGKTEAEAVAAAVALRIGREKDPEKQRLLALLPPDMRAPYRYVRLKKALAEGKTEAEAVAAATRGRAEAFRVAQAKSSATRHEQMLARFAAVVPESFRARYAGRESEVMKQWSKRAKKHGMAFADYVASLFAAKAANPDGNPRFVENLSPARLAMAKRERERKRASEAEAAPPASPLPRKPARTNPPARSLSVEEAVEAVREARQDQALAGRHAQIDAQVAAQPPPQTKFGFRQVRRRQHMVQEERKAAQLSGAPQTAKGVTRSHNCATCLFSGIFTCKRYPDRRAAANLVCADFCTDGDDTRSAYHDPDEPMFSLI